VNFNLEKDRCTRIKIIIENKGNKDVDTEILGNIEMLFMDTESGSLELYDWIKVLDYYFRDSMRQKAYYRRQAKKEDYLPFLHPAGWMPVALVDITQNSTKSLLTIPKDDPRFERVNAYLENFAAGGSNGKRPLPPEDLFGKTLTGSGDGEDYSLVLQEDGYFIYTVNGTVSREPWRFDKNLNASLYRYTIPDGTGSGYFMDFTEKRGIIYWRGQKNTFRDSVNSGYRQVTHTFTFSHFSRKLAIKETEAPE
jgi:hypothetical protein